MHDAQAELLSKALFYYKHYDCTVKIGPKTRAMQWFARLKVQSHLSNNVWINERPCPTGARTTDAQWSLFSLKSQTVGLEQQIGQINFGAFGVFLAKLSASILVLWVPCLCFPLINHYFYKKISLYIHIPNIYLELGFECEFGKQRISLCLSVVRVLVHIQ